MDKTAQLSILSTRTALFMDRNLKPPILSTITPLFMDRRPNGSYTSPTNPSVGTLILTEGEKT